MLQAPHGSRETPCTVCGDTPTRKGLCNRHYLRASRHGTTDSSTRDRGRPFDFWVEETEHGLIWTGPQHTVRDLVYGRFQGRTAHRVAYEQAYGPIPEGDYVVDHQPDCPKLCVTPEHLTLYTRGEHTAVGWQRGEITGEQIRQGHARKKG